MKKKLHAWNIPQLRVLEIEDKLANKFKEIKNKQIIPLLIEKTGYKKDTLRKFLTKIKRGRVIKGDSIPFDVLLKLCEIIGIDKYELEKSLNQSKPYK